MRRWKVYKDNEDKAWRWVAIPAHENWWEKPQGRRFPQWHMALHYANRMARTADFEIIGKPVGRNQLAKTLDALGFKQGIST
ncbi:hypothetical protein QP324_04215 [Corynebacterium sp. UMB0012]|uniref:hypothetical protein n=1 Tax=Corynebacterium sp. UMB0012 TaxID=3046344 RepID=UPI00254CFBB2|nr:hypothetical protein [Corynebacterium sp. UMB0012]MDK7047780.1 hypothetical protein [Corynebacterium sp. UMB0012]